MQTTSFTPFLRVAPSGGIWWERGDAIRLGAGFRPIQDDHQRPNPTLVAPNQRARANERTLIGALGNPRTDIVRPMMLERDGVCFVEATEFLAWLARFIRETGLEIAFPEELEHMVRSAKAKAIATTTNPDSPTFESLAVALEGWFDTRLEELPEQLQERVDEELSPMPWDELSAEQRRSLAQQVDYQNDPATEAQRRRAWACVQRKWELEGQITEWAAVLTPTAVDLERKKVRLRELRLELEAIELELGNPRSPECPSLPLEGGETSESTQIATEVVEAAPVAEASPTTTSQEIGSAEWRSQNARKAANAKHDMPGGSREKQRLMREKWETGKFSSRDRCAEEECAALGMSYSTARKALCNTPDPQRPSRCDAEVSPCIAPDIPED